jgi:5-methylcytosine-specific restriction endonuclease McrA
MTMLERDMTRIFPVAQLSNEQLLAEIKSLAARERSATAALVASLAELDERRLYLGEGYSSLFTYCTQVLHLSEHAAYGRIEAARAARRFGLILELLADGALTLTTIGLLAPHLTAENHANVLESARYKSKREVEHLLAALRPQPAMPSSVRKLPAARASAVPDTRPQAAESVQMEPRAKAGIDAVPSPPKRAAVVAPIAPAQYKVQITVSADTYAKLRRAQDLLRHTIPNGDPAVIFERALTLLLTNLENTKLAAVTRPQAPRAPARRTRHIPAAVRRDVWKRDSGRCAFVGTDGRCKERGFLEFHHVIPYALDGPATPENLQLRCRAHNAYESEQYFGSMWVRERGDLDAWAVQLGPDRAECSVVRQSPGGPSRRYEGRACEAASQENLEPVTEPPTSTCRG